uniref:CD80-like immunoglobulin C2-set domain-containing protein n=1 Tax=Glossina morsitans morsitans TaxID=37546 RepID=A0A1B0G622_GLOMM
RNLSNQSHVVLLAVPLNISGKFTCEISVEAPSFQTAMISGEMEVVETYIVFSFRFISATAFPTDSLVRYCVLFDIVFVLCIELPIEQASVTGIQPRYRIGDLVDGNCSIKYSKPAANLTWTINGVVVPPHHIKTYQIEKYDDNNLESVMSAVHFMVTTQHFVKGQMRLKCTATIFDIFKEEIESIIEEDRPRIMASGRSYDVHNYPYDPHGHGEGGYEDHNESYLTYYSAADISSSATASATLVTTYFYKNYLQQRAQQICNKFYTLLTHSTKAHQMLTTFVINLSDMIMMMIMLVTKSIWYPLMTTLVMIVIMQRALAKLHEMHKSKEITQQSDYRKTRTTYEKLQKSYRRSRHRQTHSEENQQTYRHVSLVANQNVINEFACKIKTALKAVINTVNIDCQQLSQTFAIAAAAAAAITVTTTALISSLLIDTSKRQSDDYTVDDDSYATLTNPALTTATAAALTLPTDDVDIIDSDEEASKSNNANSISKDQRLLMTAVIQYYNVYQKNATSTEATTATQIASSTNRNDSTPSIVTAITNTDANVSLNAHLMAFMAELLLNRC